MTDGALARAVRPELRALVAEASQALALLDAPRLEELALSCAALNRDWNRRLTLPGAEGKKHLARQAREAAGEMQVFAHVLEATRANLRVMNRLRDLRMGRAEYTERAGERGGWSEPSGGEANCEESDGDD